MFSYKFEMEDYIYYLHENKVLSARIISRVSLEKIYKKDCVGDELKMVDSRGYRDIPRTKTYDKWSDTNDERRGRT